MTVIPDNKMFKVTEVLLIVFLLLHVTNALNFLLAPVQLRSHVMEHVAIGKTLTSRGHTVYLVTTQGFPWEQSVEMTQIKLLTFQYPGAENLTFYSDEVVRSIARSQWDRKTRLRDMALSLCEKMMADETFLKEVRRREIDMVLIDPWPVAPCMVVLPSHLNLPYVVLSSEYLPEGALPLLPSFVPAPSSGYTDRMTFTQRLNNWLLHFRLSATGASVSTELLQKYRPPDRASVVTWSEAVRRSVMFVWTRDYLLEYPFPVLPRYVTLPGLTQLSKKSLPRDIDTYLSDAEDGVVFVSFGPTFDYLTTELLVTLFSAFKKMHNQYFVVKLPRATQKQLHVDHPGLVSSNVWLVTWCPQNNVLGHTNIRAFISHCGSNSQYEALYHGVPTIGLPVYPEHAHNCRLMQERHYGICLGSGHISKDHVIAAIRDILVDQSYKENVTRISRILKDQPLPSDTAARWLEHVTKYGADHLQSASANLSQQELWMFDVYMFCGGVVTALVVCLLFACLYVRGMSNRDRQKWD